MQRIKTYRGDKFPSHLIEIRSIFFIEQIAQLSQILHWTRPGFKSGAEKILEKVWADLVSKVMQKKVWADGQKAKSCFNDGFFSKRT